MRTVLIVQIKDSTTLPATMGLMFAEQAFKAWFSEKQGCPVM